MQRDRERLEQDIRRRSSMASHPSAGLSRRPLASVHPLAEGRELKVLRDDLDADFSELPESRVRIAIARAKARAACDSDIDPRAFRNRVALIRMFARLELKDTTLPERPPRSSC
jgi:hypothetical protein